MNSLLDNIQLLGSGRMSAVLALVAIISFGLILADSSQTAAQASELGGVDRGAILDAEGGVLANVAPGSNGRGMLAQRFPSLAASLGYQDSVGRWHGLEGSYNAALSGDGSRSSFTGFLNHLMGRQIVGDNVRTTIEPGVQEVAQRALRGRKGAVVAIDPRTGAVLALASTPCRPDKPCLDRATSFLSPPGSCFKIVTLSAALDSGEFTLNSLFSGTDAFGPNPNFDNSLYPSNVTRSDLTVLTLAQALAFSDNFVFAHIGATLGAKVLSSYAHRFYLDRRIPFALPVARSTIFADHANPTLAELETSSFGATADQVTPLQMALIVSTVANHGVMMAPRLVQDVESPGGHVISRTKPLILSRVMSRESASQVTDGMVFVVQHGSGFEAAVQGMEVAGKTGTAVSGASTANAWFISFAPARHPRVAVAVLNQYAGEGFAHAAPIARKVMLAALARH